MQRNARVGLALVQLVLGYEWLSSALTKLVHGDFASGLAADLLRAHTTGTYAAFLRHVVIPHGVAFGWLVQLGELTVALTFIVGALSGRRLPTGIAATIGALLTLNFGLAGGEHFFRVIAPDSFGEGLPLDVLATWLQVALLLYVLAPLVSLVPAPRWHARRVA